MFEIEGETNNTIVILAIFNDGRFCGHVTLYSVEGTSFLSNSKEAYFEEEFNF